jgi:V8-like Glu-specific endopeptidase
VSNTQALTAGHCVTYYDKSRKACVGSDITIVNSYGQDTGVRAKVDCYSYTRGRDFAVIEGNFKDFNKMPVKLSKENLEFGDDLVHCGFARGNRPPACSYGEYTGPNRFKLNSTAHIVPGMSGGPVIDENGVAVGINTNITNEGSQFASTIGIIDYKLK